MKGNAPLIREWLREQAHPCTIEAIEAARASDPDVLVGATSGEIADGLGATDEATRMRVYWSLGQMYAEGICGREGARRPQRYFLIREPKPACLTDEERKKRRAARARARYVPKPGLSPEELAELRQQRIDQLAACRAQRSAACKARAKAARKARTQPAPKPQPAAAKPVKLVKPAPAPKPRPVLEFVKTPRPAPKRAETVDEWMARTRKKPEVLPLGHVSKPLQRIGRMAEQRKRA